MNILHVDSSILGENSVSRGLSSRIVARVKEHVPTATVRYRDLAATPVPHLSGAALAAWQGVSGEQDPATIADINIGSDVLREFLDADVVVIGVAFYNFTISSQLKAWIDRILIPGQTFRYGPDGRPEGLVGNKRLILAIARGGFYSPGAPAAGFEHAESYLRATFGFIGITHPEIVIAEGLRAGPEQRKTAISGAETQIAALAA